MRRECSQQVFGRYTCIKFYENPSSGSRVVSCEPTDGWKDRQTDRQTDMMKLTLTFRKFSDAPNKSYVLSRLRYSCLPVPVAARSKA